MSITADTSLTNATQIRAATALDASSVFELLKQLGTEYAPDREAFDSAFAHAVDDGATTLMLVAAQSDGAVVGYAFATIAHLLHTNGCSAQLQELVVDSSVHNSGIGTRLVEAVEAVCLERGVRQLTVPSRGSANFFERIGYMSTADFLKRVFD
ncbi:N-acetyltransferase [Salinibacterium sp. UTAS2018]|uniref:GNAT family N-acetyltransferase n=1 Tax=unclassified Salinibacterium TaxID=2632331 RepID=UPI0010097C08|nr:MULTISPECIES: GNAT family N-acetyltransferase [unclassified Salinibacterium]MBH0009451.1 GNAT family N-acetyltransferase [Salinibacterium sp. SWN1162]QAV69343.1 N-acetyltransferase [Salinibacterium sp. UTAS2018]